MTTGLSNLPKIVRRKQRLGRGEGGGRGKTSGRGQKGQKARGKVRRGFEGGQMPIFRRLPKGGFTQHDRVVYSIVRLDSLNRFADNEEVTPQRLKDAGLVGSRHRPVKILSGGVLNKRLKVSAQGFSAAARSAIESAGGSALIVE